MAPCSSSDLTSAISSSNTATLLLLQHCLGNCGILVRNKLQKLQNRAAGVLTYSNYDIDAGQGGTMVYKSLHGLAPEYLSSKFEKRETAYNLRDSENKLHRELKHARF